MTDAEQTTFEKAPKKFVTQSDEAAKMPVSSEPRKKRIAATYLDKRRIEEALFEASTAVRDNDWTKRVWNPGESFESVAKAVNEDFDKYHAIRLAEAMGIEMQAAPPPPDLGQRVTSLENKVAMLLAMIENLMIEEIRRTQDVNSYSEVERPDNLGEHMRDRDGGTEAAVPSGDAGDDTDRDLGEGGNERPAKVG